MASSSTQPITTADKSILTPLMTLEGHEPYAWNNSTSDGEQEELKYISCISYFPDGKQMISGSRDKTIRRWDLREGKEIEKDREVYNRKVLKVGVSRDGRWVVHVIAGEKGIKVSEVETGIVRTFDEDSWIDCIDISADSTLLAGASWNQVRIWNLDTGASPFKIGGYLYEALGLSEDSRKLAVRSSDSKERHLQVWDVQTQKLDVQKSTHSYLRSSHVPIFWTTKHKTIVTAFNSPDDDHYSISEFDASTLNTVGAPFKHTSQICRLALSTDCVLLASASYSTIKLWAFESRQLLASFDVESPLTLLLSPDSRQLAYTSFYDAKIRICDIPANILASIESFPATSPLPRSHIPRTPAPPTTQSSAINTSSTLSSRLYRLWPFQTNRASPTIVDVPLAPGKLRIATAGFLGDDDNLIRDEDYVPPPSPSPNSHPGIVNAGQHGSGRFCFCF